MIILQIVVSIFIIGLVLLQQRGTGLGSTWGGSSMSYSTKRGAEKALFFLTIVFTILFVCLALVNVLVR